MSNASLPEKSETLPQPDAAKPRHPMSFGLVDVVGELTVLVGLQRETNRLLSLHVESLAPSTEVERDVDDEAGG